MVIYDKIVEDIYEPRNTSVLWLRPVKGGFSFYRYKNSKWEILRLMDDHGTVDPEDDTPIDINEGQLGPDTVGTEQIIDNSVVMDDLNDSVKEKIQKTYYENEEELHMGFDIANTFGSHQNPIVVEEEEEP